MSRRDEYFDAMLRQLGAAYYQAIHGDGTAARVELALESAEAAGGREGAAGAPCRQHRTGRWLVSDVMTTDVVSVAGSTPYKQLARIISERKLSAVPVVTAGGRLAGMVSEADVLRKQERGFGRLAAGLPLRTRRQRAQAEARCAAELMTSPAITIYPDAPVGAAARLMNGRRLRRLPVVDPSGKLIGIVSRRDLLSVFLRPDGDIADEVRGTLAAILPQQAGNVEVAVRDGVVILSGTVPRPGLIPVAERLASGVDGAVAVIGKLAAGTGSGTAPART
jgi:CBS domain-containing protein